MKTVFLLGAGASRSAGGPVMSDFLDRAQNLMQLNAPELGEGCKDFQDVFQAIAELQGVHSKAHLDLDNIELVFGAIEMGLLLGKLGDLYYEEIKNLRESLVVLIYRTLELSMKFPVRELQIQPPGAYQNFMTTLRELVKTQPHQDPHQFAFLTFNYDLGLDYALHFYGFRPDYCLDGSPKPGTTPLLKLHGSINWGTTGDDRIAAWSLGNVSHERAFLGETSHVIFDLGSKLGARGFQAAELKGPPIIVPPSWNKNSYHVQLSNVWAQAARAFGSAENIFIIGYSLPVTDSFVRYLYALGSESATRVRNFVVINPDRTSEQRFRDLIGPGIANRFSFIPAAFEDAIGQIQGIIQKR
jgi:hypothetical protein